MSLLLDEVRDQIRTLHYSIRTEEAYLKWVREFILFHGKRHPNEMGLLRSADSYPTWRKNATSLPLRRIRRFPPFCSFTEK